MTWFISHLGGDHFSKCQSNSKEIQSSLSIWNLKRLAIQLKLNRWLRKETETMRSKQIQKSIPGTSTHIIPYFKNSVIFEQSRTCTICFYELKSARGTKSFGFVTNPDLYAAPDDCIN